MSTAVFPLGMNSMPSSGYNHRSTYYNKQYLSWKGTGVNSNPVGIASGHIRPLTNKDPGNVFQTGFGLPRPIKHFRKGRVIPSQPIEANNLQTTNPNAGNPINIDEAGLINYNMNRFVKSSKGTSLGGGFGGSGLLNDLQDKPGAYTVKINPDNEKNGIAQTLKDCQTCEGIAVVTNYYPNKTFLEDNPEPNTTNPILCCNEQRKARRRAIYASTNLKQNYYTTHYQYLQNRCKTYEQKAFNFVSKAPDSNALSKPGDPLSIFNTYIANCYPNAQIYDATETAIVAKIFDILLTNNIITNSINNNLKTIQTLKELFNWIQTLPTLQKSSAQDVFNNFINNPYSGMPLSGPVNANGCKLTVYKPNNYQYAKQGAVDSSTRNLKLNVDTISTNAASIQNYNNTGQFLVNANELYAGEDPTISNLYKNKAPEINSPSPYFQYQNKKLCCYQGLPEYQIPISQPSPYKYYAKAVFSSNHFSQSPNTYTTISA